MGCLLTTAMKYNTIVIYEMLLLWGFCRCTVATDELMWQWQSHAAGGENI